MHSLMDGQNSKGFTIVELLIVVVVIAILAAITIVSFNGIQSRAHDSAVQVDLRNIGNQVQGIYAEVGAYPVPASNSVAPPGMENIELNLNSYDDSTYNFYYCVSTVSEAFALTARSKSGKSWTYKSSSGMSEYTASWTTSGSICPPTLGVSSSSSNYEFAYGRSTTGNWFAWVR